MKRIFLFLVFLFLLFEHAVFSQHSSSFVQAYWANDLTIQKDMYETNFFKFGYYSSKRSVTRFLLPGAQNSVFGFGVDHGIYTPYKKKFKDKLYDDHPYGGTLTVRLSRLSVPGSKLWMFYSGFSVGVLGPASGAEQIQSTIHEWLPTNTVPKGWSNQISNRAIFNYRLEVTRRVHRSASFEVAARLGGTFGSPRLFLDPALLFRFGRVDDDFFGRIPVQADKLRAFGSFEVKTVLVGYDVFHDFVGLESETTYAETLLSVNLMYKKWMFIIGQTVNTPQFEDSQWHGQGFIDINFSF